MINVSRNLCRNPWTNLGRNLGINFGKYLKTLEAILRITPAEMLEEAPWQTLEELLEKKSSKNAFEKF